MIGNQVSEVTIHMIIRSMHCYGTRIGNSGITPRALYSMTGTAVVMTALDGVNGTICNAQQYCISNPYSLMTVAARSISCLTHGECIGFYLICLRL